MLSPPITISNILGNPVLTQANQRIGHVVDVFLDPDDLEVSYLLVCVQLPTLEQEHCYLIHSLYFSFADTPPHLLLSTDLQYGTLDKIPQPLPSSYQDKQLGSYKDFKQQVVPLLSLAGHQSDS